MKTLYLELGMGAAGDMLTAALLELFPEDKQRDIVDMLNALGIPGVRFVQERSVKCGITGTHMRVLIEGEEEGGHEYIHEHEHEHFHGHEHEHEHEHEHSHGHEYEHEHEHEHELFHGHEHTQDHEHTHDPAHAEGHIHSHSHNDMAGIDHIVNGHMNASASVKANITEVYKLIAEAEGYVHGKPVSEIHFHEVGTMDAVADVAAVSFLIEMLAPDRIIASPVNTGSGTVRCAHGIMPVPAPATAYLLRGIPSYDSGIRGELLTPTGAALIKHFADDFGRRPAMSIERTGYGMGRKDFDAPNCVRVFLGEALDDASYPAVFELEANIDDMSAEEVGFAMGQILKAGALDVWTEAACMKKNRPGVILRLLCREAEKDSIIKAVFKHTSTIGIRESLKKRYTLNREISSVETPYGTVRIKRSEGYGTERKKYEYDDLAAIAESRDISLSEARRIAAHSVSKH